LDYLGVLANTYTSLSYGWSPCFSGLRDIDDVSQFSILINEFG
jgi:hypothetical protein